MLGGNVHYVSADEAFSKEKEDIDKKPALVTSCMFLKSSYLLTLVCTVPRQGPPTYPLFCPFSGAGNHNKKPQVDQGTRSFHLQTVVSMLDWLACCCSLCVLCPIKSKNRPQKKNPLFPINERPCQSFFLYPCCFVCQTYWKM